VKFSKSSWIFLVAGIVIIAGISLIMTRTQQTDQQKKLQAELDEARQKISQIKIDDMVLQKTQLTQQLTNYNSDQKNIKTKLTSSLDSINVTGSVLEAAKEYSVNIKEIVSSGVSSTDLGGIKCEALSVNLRAGGSLRDIADFVGNLTRIFPTGIIKSAEIEIKETTPLSGSDIPLESPVEKATVNVNLIIYNYKGK
jgi:hypothetical protein